MGMGDLSVISWAYPGSFRLAHTSFSVCRCWVLGFRLWDEGAYVILGSRMILHTIRNCNLQSRRLRNKT